MAATIFSVYAEFCPDKTSDDDTITHIDLVAPIRWISNAIDIISMVQLIRTKNSPPDGEWILTINKICIDDLKLKSSIKDDDGNSIADAICKTPGFDQMWIKSFNQKSPISIELVDLLDEFNDGSIGEPDYAQFRVYGKKMIHNEEVDFLLSARYNANNLYKKITVHGNPPSGSSG